MICFRLITSPGRAAALVAAGPAAAADPPGLYSVYSNPDSIAVDRAFDTTPADESGPGREAAHPRHRPTRALPRAEGSAHDLPHSARGAGKLRVRHPLQHQAWYKTGDGIFLDDTLMPETNLFHRSILLHEMVHYFQDRAGEYGNMNDCERWFHRELDAYTIQNRYLGVIGHPSRVAYVGDNCANMTSKAKTAEPTQAFDGIRGRVDPDQH